MKIKQDFIPKDGDKRPGIKMDWETITVHNTGNPKSTAENERAWLTNPTNKRQASWHYVICEDTIIQAVPDNEVAWHAGDGRGNGNMRSLSLEICESGDFEKSKATAAKFIAMKLDEKQKGIDAVVQHNSWSGKDCPRLLRPIWSQFITMIKKELAPPPSLWENELITAIEFVREMNISDGANPELPLTRGQLFIMLNRFFKKLH